MPQVLYEKDYRGVSLFLANSVAVILTVNEL